jgi:hypothetical protein
MNHKSITYDIDDWEVISNKSNNIEYRYIENRYIENIYNENWCDNINNTLLLLNLDNKENWRDKDIKNIIKDAKKSWNEKIKKNNITNENIKKRNL